MDHIIYCRIRLAAIEIASAADVAYWTEGGTRAHHHNQIIKEFRNLQKMMDEHMAGLKDNGEEIEL